MRHLKLFSLLIAVLLSVLAETSYASVYLQGSVTANGDAYTSAYGSVNLSCSGSNVWASDWASINSSGEYSMTTTNNAYGPCGSYYSGSTFTSCEIYASPYWNDSTLASSNRYPVTLDCNGTVTQNIALNVKDKTIAVAVTAGGNPVTSDITVYCSQQESPWTYSYVTSAADGTYNVPVIAGNYSCSAYCTNWSSCDYGGYPSTTVAVTSADTTKSASLTFSLKDKNIAVSVTAGDEPITSGITVSCNQKESPWTNGSTSTIENGIYNVGVSAGNYTCSAYCNTWPCSYSGYPSTSVTVASSDSSVSASLEFMVKDKTLRVTVMGGDTVITSGVSVYASEQGGSWSYSSVDYATDGKYVMQVGEAKYYVSAYCTNWSSCEVAGYPNATVTIEESDTTVDITLTFLRNDATISGVVTGGGSGVADAGVSVYSYKVSGGSTGTAWSIAKSLSKAVVEGGTASTTMVSSWANTDSSGAFQVKLPAGTYTVSVSPPWSNTAYGQSSVEVTATANATTSVSIALPSKTAVISGVAKDASGTGISGVNISGWSYGGQSGSNDYFWTQTDSSGNFSVNAVEGLKYNVSAYFWSSSSSNTVCNYNNEGMQSVVASATAQTVNFTYPTCDCTLTLNAVDSSSNIITSIYGGVNAAPTALASGDYWYGIWGNISNGTGTMKVQSDTEYTLSPYIWDNNYVQGDDATATCSDGATTVNLSLLALDATISGNYVDGDGAALTLDQYSYMSVYATKGKAYRNCTASSSGFSCSVSEGTWCLGYWIDPYSGYASSASGSSTSCAAIVSGGTSSQNIALLRTGTISVSVIDVTGGGKYNVWVEATPYSNKDKGKNDYQHMYMSNGCMSDENGACTINVGAASGEGTVYYLNSYIPYSMKASDNIMNPQEVSVAVVAGSTVTADPLTFERPDGTSVITVTQGSTTASISLGKGVSKSIANLDESASSPVAKATVDCFSPSGGSFEVETDSSGIATCPCSVADTWKAVAHNMVANNLWMSEATDVTCLADGGAGSVVIQNVATVPEGKSVTITDVSAQSLTIELSDGFSVFFPIGSLGSSGQATCNVDITVTPFTSNRRPVSFYGYTVNCQDGSGSSIIQLNSNATFTVPVNQTQVENIGLTLNDVEMCYFDDSNGAYNGISTATTDVTNKVITYQQNHLTDFSVVGNGNLAGIAGTEAGDGANEYGDETGVASASGSSGCGCNVGNDPKLIEKVIAPIILLGLYGVLYVAKLAFKRTKNSSIPPFSKGGSGGITFRQF